MDLHLATTFVVATLLLSLAPGPDMLFIIANGTSGGRRAGVVAALGVSTGLAFHTTAAALGLGFLIRSAPGALTAVRIGGAVVLVYLAITTWRSSRHPDRKPATTGAALPRRSLKRTYLMAALTNLANPKVILFYVAFLPQFLTTGTGAWPVTAQLFVLGAMFIVVGLSVDGPVGMLSGTLSERITSRPSIRKWLERVSAGVFAGLAARLMFDSQ